MTAADTQQPSIEQLADRKYKDGWVTDIESESLPPGLNEDVVRAISAKKNEPEWLTEWRLKAYRHWLNMQSPEWPFLPYGYGPVDYQDVIYYSAPKQDKDKPQSLDEVDPELLKTYEKLGIPLEEQKMLAGVAVDAVFDSVSVATTFKDKLAELGIIFLLLSLKRLKSMAIWYGNISVRWCPTQTTFLPHSIPRCSATVRLSISQRVCDVPWS